MNSNIELVIKKYNELKKELIPIDRVTTENDNLVFFQNKKLNELKDNQSLSYQNIGEGLENIIKTINSYIESIKNLSVVESPGKISDKKYIINSVENNQISSNLKLINDNEFYAYNLTGYKESATFNTYIDQVVVSINNELVDTDKVETIDTEPIIYWLDGIDNTIKKVDSNIPFKLDSIFGIILVGIKIKEEIKKDTVLEVDKLSCKIEIRYNSLKNVTETISLVDSLNQVKLHYDVKENDILFFNIIDLFGNIIDIKTALQKTYTLTPTSNIKSAGEKNTRDVANVITINNFSVPFSVWERLIITKGYNAYKTISLSKFKIYKKPQQKDYVYFPAGASIVQNVKETIDEF